MANETNIKRFEKYNPHMRVIDNDGDGSVSQGDQVRLVREPSAAPLSFGDTRFEEARKRASRGAYATAYVFEGSRGQAAAGVGGAVANAPLLFGRAFQTVFHGVLGDLWDGEARLPVLGFDVMPDVVARAGEKYLGMNSRFGNPDDVGFLTRLANTWTYTTRVAGGEERVPESHAEKARVFFFGERK